MKARKKTNPAYLKTMNAAELNSGIAKQLILTNKNMIKPAEFLPEAHVGLK